MNRFMELDLVDKGPEELWMEVHNTAEESMTKTNPKKEKCKKVMLLPEEALQKPEERREAKSKQEWIRYTQWRTMLRHRGKQ